MFTITQDFINQFGINVKGHLLVLKQIRLTENIETFLSDSDQLTPQTNSNKNIHFRAETYLSQDAFDSGAQGMPLNPSGNNGMGGMGDFYFSDPTVDETNLVEKCHTHLLTKLFPEDVPVSVPYSVTRRQALQQLTILGVIEQINTIIAGIADPTERQMVEIFWKESTSFERSNPYIIMISDALGWTSADLDNAFIEAKKL